MSERIAIFGAGRSGQAARKLAEQLGHSTVCFDENAAGARRQFEGSDLAAFDRFVFSPGFAEGHPWRVLAASAGKPIVGELAYAAAYWTGSLIGITGTNGKTTTTRLMCEAYRAMGVPAVACGNIGLPLSEVVLSGENTEASVAVVEISSFQAELATGLRLNALLWTTFAEDHLDRYATMQAYFEAKAALLDCLAPGAPVVLSGAVAQAMVHYGRNLSGAVVAGAGSATSPEGPFSAPPQRQNFEVAAAYWRTAGYAMEPLLVAAEQFEPSAHRCQMVCERDGIRYWNDSKATNFEAALAAAAALPRPIVWIGGGQSKGGDVAAFARQMSGLVDRAVLYGAVGAELADAMTLAPDQFCRVVGFESAVHAAEAMARKLPGAQVLLSPGFASFDQFKSYDDRGKSFVSIVLGL